jgi:DNA polymerase
MTTTCRRCSISVANEFKPCWRTGDVGDILFIGEAPGHTENKTKIPFTGRSGVYLRSFIDRYGLTSFSQITNVIKCQPPRNRNPYSEEISNCSSYLIDDIKIVDPKIIVLVGTIATQIFRHDNKGVRASLNKPFMLGSTIVISIYHPSYILREGVTFEYIKSFNIISELYNAVNKYYSKKRFKLKTKD